MKKITATLYATPRHRASRAQDTEAKSAKSKPRASQEQAKSKPRASQEQAKSKPRASQEVIAKRWTLSMAAITMYRAIGKSRPRGGGKHRVGLAQEVLEVIDRYAEVKHSWKMELDNFLEMQDDEAAKFAERFKKVYEEFTRGELDCWEQWAKRLKKENTKRWLRKLRSELMRSWTL